MMVEVSLLLPVWTLTVLLAPRANVPKVNLWLEASVRVQPLRLRAMEVELVMVTHSALRLEFESRSLPGELY